MEDRKERKKENVNKIQNVSTLYLALPELSEFKYACGSLLRRHLNNS
jgi:hypothetical protein